MTDQEELDILMEKIASIKEENFGVCPVGMYMDGLLDKMWELQDKIKLGETP